MERQGQDPATGQILEGEERRLSYGKMKAGNSLPACVQACPTSALTFADQGDETGPVRKYFDDVNEHEHAEDRNTRGYRLLEEMGTKPNVIYLKKVDQFPISKGGNHGG